MSIMRFSRQESDFIAKVAPYSRDVDLALALGRSTQSIKNFRYERCIPGRNRKARPLSRRAVLKAYERFRRGERLRLDNLRLWTQWRGRKRGRQRGNRNEAWADGDVCELLERVGCEPLEMIAVDLRRSWFAAYRKLQQLGKAHLVFEFSCAHLAARLGIVTRTVNVWCSKLLDGEPLVRSWREVHPRIVHRDDALYLLNGGYSPRQTDWLDLRREFWGDNGEEAA